MAWTDIVPESVDELCNHLMHFSEDGRYACRGQARTWNKLTTSLDRILSRSPHLSETDCANYEMQCIRVFHERAPYYLEKSEIGHLNGLVGSLLLMQHYGAPTRLLDWTRSPWVSAYFCVLFNVEEPGEIWLFDFDQMERTIYGWKFPGVSNKIVNSDIMSAFESSRFPPTPENWFCTYRPSNLNPRMMAQQSIFTLSGLRQDHNALVDSYLPDDATAKLRIVVSPDLKEGMRGRLVRMNVTASALFPGVDGLGRFISQLIETWVPQS